MAFDYEHFHLDPSFFEEEVRCEYTIPARMKRIWAVQLELLNELLRVCAKHDIKVVAYAGTLLGAVRHKGYIPWDDDVDVCLLKEDYEKLKAVSYEFKEPFFFQDADTDRRYFWSYPRLRNSNTTGVIANQATPDYNNGIFLDIFLMNGMTEDMKEFKRQKRDLKLMEMAVNAYKSDISSQHGLKKAAVAVVKAGEHLFTTQDKLLKKMYDVQCRFDSTATRFSSLNESRESQEKYCMLREDFDNTTLLPFENLMIPVPADYDKTLKRIYGDYMKFPPVEQRGLWHDGIITFDPDIPYKEWFARQEKSKK